MEVEKEVWEWIDARFGKGYSSSDVQLTRKLLEEVAELSKEVVKGRREDAILELGDTLIVLIRLAAYLGTTLEGAIQAKLPELWSRVGGKK